MIKSSVLSTEWAWGVGTLRSAMADQSPELLRGWESKAQAPGPASGLVTLTFTATSGQGRQRVNVIPETYTEISMD